MENYLEKEKLKDMPRIPLAANFDITYRCNNNCRHCWLRLPPNSPKREDELSLDEIKHIVDDARKMGCRRWNISGGEPMLRPDFPEIFDYITSKSFSYSLNSNGTLITPKIARLLRKKGSRMISIYGATAEIHDYITRNEGSFDATMRGFAYLKEAGVSFIVQVVPMKDNYHQLNDMVDLAKKLGGHWRFGASWLYLSADGDPEKNRQIKCERLAARQTIELDNPDVYYEEQMAQEEHRYYYFTGDDRVFAPCIAGRRDFHLDPYGQMSFCAFIKEPELRYDLRKGSFQECWDDFIPSLADKVRGGEEYLENCAKCDLRNDCAWCPVYGYLEHGRFSAKVEYLCKITHEKAKYKEEWKKTHRRYYQVAGVTLQVDGEIPIQENTFHPKFDRFLVKNPGDDVVVLRHHFYIRDLDDVYLGKEVYRTGSWAVYRRTDTWIYVGLPSKEGASPRQVVVFNDDYTKAEIYNPDESYFNREGGLESISFFTDDRILLAQIMARRNGLCFHSGGVSLNGSGILFPGQANAGKTTIVGMLKDEAEIMSDDMVITRKSADGFKIYGSWIFGQIPETSPASAELSAIVFLAKDTANRLVPIKDRKEVVERLLTCLVKPLTTKDWWERILPLVEDLAARVPAYMLHFDKTGGATELLKDI